MRLAPAALLASLLVLMLSSTAAAQALYAGNTIAYQGKLELSGQPVSDQVALTFRFYPSLASTTELDSFAATVTPADGTFSVEIGPLADAVFAADELFVAIEVDGLLLEGRQRVIAAPRAARADVAKDLTVTGTAVITGNTVSNDLEIGDMDYDGWAGLAHTNQAGIGHYALMQKSDGSQTLVNAAPGGSVHLRVGNADRVVVDKDGNLDVGGQTELGYTRKTCPFPEGATTADCSCAAGQRILSGGTTGAGAVTVGPLTQAVIPWISVPVDDDTWRVGCLRTGFIYAGGFNYTHTLTRNDCGDIEIICARVAN